VSDFSLHDEDWVESRRARLDTGAEVIEEEDVDDADEVLRVAPDDDDDQDVGFGGNLNGNGGSLSSGYISQSHAWHQTRHVERLSWTQCCSFAYLKKTPEAFLSKPQT
jgi:hypothetical protein